MRTVVMLVCLAATYNAPVIASTRYIVRIDQTPMSGLAASMALDFTAGGGVQNELRILAFETDGRRRPADYEGGPAEGDLFSSLNPAGSTVLENGTFYGTIVVPFDSLGARNGFAIEITENGPQFLQQFPDEVSFYLFRTSDGLLYPGSDPEGAGALFSVDITGEAGGEVLVMSPMEFVPPDTIRLSGLLTGVPVSERPMGRLTFLSVRPLPSKGGVHFVFSVPDPGGAVTLQIIDVAGRRIAEPLGTQPLKAGSAEVYWDLSGHGGARVGPGVYFAVLRMGGQSLVRRVVITP